MLLIENYLDVARDRLKDKNFQGAIERADSALRMDAANAAAQDIKKQAETALQSITTLASAARAAFTRGDTAEATKAVEQLLEVDPKNAVIAELSGKLNANFEASAQAGQRAAAGARTLADQKTGANADPAYAEGLTFLEQAANALNAREFTSATQRFVQAKDAFERARRAVEAKEREAARAAEGRVAPTVAEAAPVSTPVVAMPTPTATPQILTPTLVSPTAAPLATPPPTPSPTPQVAPTAVAEPVAAATPPPTFSTGRTSISSTSPAGGGRQPRGFDMSGVSVQDFSGAFEFEVAPNPPPAGGGFTLRIFLRNTGQREGKLQSLTGKVAGGAAAPLRIVEDNVRPGQRVLVAEYRGTWPERGPWSFEVEALSSKNERYRATFSAR